jgi:hypothetical protein
MIVRRDKLLDSNWVKLQVLGIDEDGHASFGSRFLPKYEMYRIMQAFYTSHDDRRNWCKLVAV